MEGQSAPLAELADHGSPRRPAGKVGALVNRILVHARRNQLSALRPHVSHDHGGFVVAGVKPRDLRGLLDDSLYEGVVLLDPAVYEKRTATPDAPFLLPEAGLFASGLDDVLDQQLQAGATVAITPTKFISAGDTDSLAAAARQMRRLDRQDVLFLAPIDISLVDREHIHQVTAILADVECPVALVLGRKVDSLTHVADRVIPNLRTLAATVDLMPVRTGLNAFDLVAHGAFAGAIRSVGPHPAPSVLVPEFLSWWRGGELADLFGARPNLAPRCPCPVCDEKRVTRFLKKSDADEAMCHAVALWSSYAGDMLEQPTMRSRARYWRQLCRNALGHHAMFTHQLRRVRPLKPPRTLEVWANLPLWPTDAV
nr:hypothetical protein [Kibdelosporangium sp. MJ126-NF4]CTQ99374.1 hypothetical protein [Kibdelosporangium sp. MJ126-NF4]